MKIIRRCSRVAAVLSLLFFTALAWGQTNQGVIAGNVLDSTGAVIPNASIVAKNQGTGSVYRTKATSAGSYRFPSIELGRYTLTASAQGFKDTVSQGVEVRVGTVSSLDITLAAGAAAETVTVNANAPTVETQSSDMGGTVTTQQITELPLALGGVGAMRSPEAFVFLIPGNTGPGSANNNNGIFISKLAGGQNFGAEILVDGASTIRSENGSSFDEEAPSVEAYSEFKVTTSTPQAEFGRTTGGIENFVIKSGTNNYHGTAFDLFQNDALNAGNWFDNGNKAARQAIGDPSEKNFNRQADHKNDYGVSLGGPLSIPHIYNGKDKTFFFFSWEAYRQTLGGVTVSNVPTAAERTGDFSDQLIGGPTGYMNPCDGTPIFFGQIFDPATTKNVGGVNCRTAFPGNKIPQSRFSPLAQKLLAFYPAPNTNTISQNYSLRDASKVANTTYTIRVDHSLGSHDKFFGSYSSRENTRNNPTHRTLPGYVDPDTQIQDFITHFGRAGWDHFFSGNLLNHLNVGYNRSNSINGSFEAATGVNYAKQLGIPNILTGFPRINISGIVPLSRNQHDDNIDNGIRVNDSVSYQFGRNSFKFGIDYRYQQYSPLAQGALNGFFNFNGNQTRAAQTGNAQIGTGLGLASFLLGDFDSAGATIPSHQARWISAYWAGFVQDDFKVTNNLVLNLGIRYSVDQPRKEAQNNTSNFSPTAIDPKSGIPGALVFASNCGNCNKRWADTWFKDFAPRIGFAYSPASSNGKTSVRGGFATLYGPLQYSDFGGATLTGYTNPINQNTNGFDATYQIDNGLLPYSVGTNLDPGFYDNGDSSKPRNFSNYIKPSYGRPAQVNQWSLQVQQELAKDLIATVGYIGSSGAHLKSQAENDNNIAPTAANFALGDILGQSFGAVTAFRPTKLPYANFNPNARYFQALRPFPQYDFIATDCCLQNVGHSSYDALIVSVERRMSQGLNLQASYTWSKTITNADSIINVTNGVSQEQNANDGKKQKFISNQDIPHTFVTSFIYELPFGHNKRFLSSTNPFIDRLVSGYKIGGVLRYQSGEPMSFGCAFGIPGFQNCISFDRVAGSSIKSKARNGHIDPFRRLRYQLANPGKDVDGPDPNVDSEFNGLLNSGNKKYDALQTAPAFIDQNNPVNRSQRAVKLQTPGAPPCIDCDNGAFQFGTVPRVTAEARNYLYNNEDFSFIKETPISEGVNFTVKLELLNAFNRHVFGTPDNGPYSRTFGVPGFTIDGPRTMQVTGRIRF